MDNPETQAILDTRYRTKTNTAKQTQHRKLSEYLEDTKGVIRIRKSTKNRHDRFQRYFLSEACMAGIEACSMLPPFDKACQLIMDIPSTKK